MKESEWKHFLDDYYFQTYYREPIHPVFTSIAAQFQTNAQDMSDDAFVQFLSECRQLAADFEKMVDGTSFGTELDVKHGQIIGKNSNFQNHDVRAALEKGYTRSALEVLSGYEANVTSSFGYWLAEKYENWRGRKGTADLIDLYLSGQVVASLRSLRKDYVVKAFRYGYSNKSISEATQLESNGLEEATVKGYTEDKSLVGDFCIGEYYPVVDFDMTGLGETKVPSLPPCEAPSAREAKQTIDRILARRDELDRCAQKIVENFRLKALRYKNVEINLALHPEQGPLLDVELDLLLISATMAVLNDSLELKRDILLSKRWTKNSLSRLVPGGKARMSRDSRIEGSSPDRITRNIDDIAAQSPSGMVSQERSSGVPINVSVGERPLLVHVYDQQAKKK